MRWAIVAGAVRKALATSSVLRPQTSRSVRATCAPGGKAGWQQVKIKAQSVVLDVPIVIAAPSGGRRVAIEPGGQVRERGVEADATTDGVGGLEAAGGNQPRPRVRRHPVPRPLHQRRREGVVKRFFRKVEVAAKQPDEGGEDPSRFRAIDGVHHLPDLLGGNLVRHAGPPNLRIPGGWVEDGLTQSRKVQSFRGQWKNS